MDQVKCSHPYLIACPSCEREAERKRCVDAVLARLYEWSEDRRINTREMVDRILLDIEPLERNGG